MNPEEITNLIMRFTTQFRIPPIALVGVGTGLMMLAQGPEHVIQTLRQVADQMETYKDTDPQERPQLGAPDWCE